MKHYLKEMEIGESFEGFYVLRKKELRTTRTGNPFLILEFGDKSGRLRGNIWEDAHRFNANLHEETIVKLQGMIESYQGNPQVVIRKIRNSRPDDEIDYSDLLPSTEIDVEKAFQKLLRITNQIKNHYVKKLLCSFLYDEGIAADFKRAPGGKLWHHNRLGGLLEHTLGVLMVCRTLARLYPEVNKDILTAGAILHDIGKIEEFKYDISIDYTDRGRMIGHITMGSQWIADHAYEIENFPDDLLDKIQHLVLSHQDEFGSPVRPCSMEAFLLHYADLIDSKMDALRRIKRDAPEGERWKFVNLLERHIDVSDWSDMDEDSTTDA